jgi:hypothetical protein
MENGGPMVDPQDKSAPQHALDVALLGPDLILFLSYTFFSLIIVDELDSHNLVHVDA